MYFRWCFLVLQTSLEINLYFVDSLNGHSVYRLLIITFSLFLFFLLMDKLNFFSFIFIYLFTYHFFSYLFFHSVMSSGSMAEKTSV